MEIQMVDNLDANAKLRVVGVGGGGNNALNNMITAGLKGVEFIAANTDLQALEHSKARVHLQLGHNLTRGLGAGADPEVGRQAALEDRDKIKELLTGSDMVFVTAGLGGGTGTGGAPVIAEVAKEVGALTVAVVTKPFDFEGKRRLKQAEQGVEELKKVVDTLIVIPNIRLRSLAPKNARFADMLKKADEVLLYAVRGISDLIITPGLINLDFADVRTVMSEMGVALMGTGEASGDDRALQAATRAINNPLLEDISIDGARGVLVNITASEEITIDEVSEASTFIQEAAHENANIIWGTVIDTSMGERMRVTVIATGIGQAEEVREVKRMAVAGGGRDLDISEIDENNVRIYRRGNASLRGLTSPGSRERRPMSDSSDLDWPAFLRRQAD
ncbi:MAG: cell division protein FtsZ [Proteobacteria bacterium]|nr:cell division protein FtsZ [Pseudomonadota bacterium]MBU1452959.1 cell division protein FtsZ [Pseudomonadota bacterium]MBU2467921.1 cell division protein FtsZ [Pseudomonadota bacterium]MBU2517399.1 cell division protein FtsZ [Pseudomonadota bacterium]